MVIQNQILIAIYMLLVGKVGNCRVKGVEYVYIM